MLSFGQHRVFLLRACSLQMMYSPDAMMIAMPIHLVMSGKSPKKTRPRIVAEMISKYWNGASTESGASGRRGRPGDGRSRSSCRAREQQANSNQDKGSEGENSPSPRTSLHQHDAAGEKRAAEAGIDLHGDRLVAVADGAV